MATPHLALPVRYVNGRVVTVEQDSDAEIAQAVEVILRFEPGMRPELPDFGVPDQTFRVGGVDRDAIVKAIEKFEPRVRAFVEDRPDQFDQLVRHVTVELRGGQDG